MNNHWGGQRQVGETRRWKIYRTGRANWRAEKNEKLSIN
jgi:hypothetical protein